MWLREYLRGVFGVDVVVSCNVNASCIRCAIVYVRVITKMTRGKKAHKKQWKYKEDRKIGGRWVRSGSKSFEWLNEWWKQTKADELIMDNLLYTHTEKKRERVK